MKVFQGPKIGEGADPVGSEVQCGEQRECRQVFDEFDLVVLQEEAAEVGEVVEVLDLADAVVLQPQRLQSSVLAEVLDLAEALVMEVEDIVEGGRHVQVVLATVILKSVSSIVHILPRPPIFNLFP